MREQQTPTPPPPHTHSGWRKLSVTPSLLLPYTSPNPSPFPGHSSSLSPLPMPLLLYERPQTHRPFDHFSFCREKEQEGPLDICVPSLPLSAGNSEHHPAWPLHSLTGSGATTLTASYILGKVKGENDHLSLPAGIWPDRQPSGLSCALGVVGCRCSRSSKPG